MFGWVAEHGGFRCLPRPIFGLDTDAILSGVDVFLCKAADMSPVSYGEEPISELWPETVSEIYEINLVKGALERQIPVFGLPRGAKECSLAACSGFSHSSS